ncbi:MAG: GTP cyclohydrolase, FolE2/MptA family [bacterium]
MPDKKRHLVDVDLNDFKYPLKVSSPSYPNGMPTIATISIHARINHDFAARWIEKFINILHQHRDSIGSSSLKTNVLDYLNELEANKVQVIFEYPYFVEKITPISKQKDLVPYQCKYTVRVSCTDNCPISTLKIEIPTITTDPASKPDNERGLFAQKSVCHIEVESDREVYPDEFVSLVDRHALIPIHSFLSLEDKAHLIETAHTKCKSSVVMIEEIQEELAQKNYINWYKIKCNNYGLLNLHNTGIGAEKDLGILLSD